MVIQHNLMALNSYRQLAGNNAALAKNLEKLASGYRINRAGDDAAGLAISEKMRAQITGLNTAIKNAQDGISLIQTAEGALTEVHAMLNRMVELATQASNGIYDDQIDRKALDDEFQQLKDEIDRISQATNFNGKNLLDGGLAVVNNGVSLSPAINDRFILDMGKEPVAAKAAIYEITNVGAASTLDPIVRAWTSTTSPTDIADYFGINESEYNINITAAGLLTITAKVPGVDPNHAKITSKTNSDIFARQIGMDAYDKITIDVAKNASDLTLIGKTMSVNGRVYTFVGNMDKGMDGVTEITTFAIQNGTKLADGSYAIFIEAAAVDTDIADAIAEALQNVEGAIGDPANWDPITGELLATTPLTTVASTGGTTTVTIDPAVFTSKAGNAKVGGLNLQIGDTGDKYNIITVGVNDMSTKGLGIQNLNIRSYEAAVAAVGTIAQQGDPGTIKGAINLVSAQRGALGALQNRLEHTINNIGVTAENMTAAESRIRDTDMAYEMMLYTKNSILVQAAQAMLAQANMVPQGILQLLR